MVEDEPSNFSARHEHVNNRLNEIAPKMGIIMSGLNLQNKIVDKSEWILFENMFRTYKYKYEDIIKVLNLYQEVREYKLIFRLFFWSRWSRDFAKKLFAWKPWFERWIFKLTAI